MHEIPTVDDVFEYEAGNFDGRTGKVGVQRWIFLGTHTSAQGQEIATLRSIEGGHMASVNADWLRTGEARFDAWPDPVDGVMHPARVVLRPVKIVAKGGAAAAHQKFADHQKHFLGARKALNRALDAHAAGDAAAAATFETEAHEHLDLMDGVRDLKLGHVATKMLAEYERARDAAKTA